jgi:hypothetical protein
MPRLSSQGEATPTDLSRVVRSNKERKRIQKALTELIGINFQPVHTSTPQRANFPFFQNSNNQIPHVTSHEQCSSVVRQNGDIITSDSSAETSSDFHDASENTSQTFVLKPPILKTVTFTLSTTARTTPTPTTTTTTTTSAIVSFS